MFKKLLLLLPFLTLWACSENETRFESLASEFTGIAFNNVITENDSINILTYEYTYNGAGVAISDFNNDGLEDIFFSANMAGNKLYLNRGNLKFEDISEKAKITGSGKWCTAAISVDINHDGLMDIYVPASSTNNSTSDQRENLLYINQGGDVPTFIESAKAYGVNDNGFSEGAAFFDYDNDGDLDLYVLTNVIDHSPNYFRKKVVDGSYPNNDRLYRNDSENDLGHPVFTNVNEESGILLEGFGLGINITDINKDGWKDIYITNDYASDDILYINNQNGTFTDQAKRYFKHTNFAAMGNDVADINNDGLQDFVALDMMPQDNYRKKMFVSATNPDIFRLSDKLGYTYQYMRNTLQLNSGLDQDFQEISLLAGIAETDWSWTPSLADFDNDGYRDLLITNGFPKDVTDKDFMAYRSEAQQLMSKKTLLAQIPEVKISNYAYQNLGGLRFKDVTKSWGLEKPSFSSGASYGDLDNDGDLDYIVSNTNDEAFVYKNKTAELLKKNSNYLNITLSGAKLNPNAIGATILASVTKADDFFFELNPYRGYKSSVSTACHIGLGDKEVLKSLTVIWPNGQSQTLNNIKANQNIALSINDAKEKYDWEAKKETIPALFEEQNTIDFVHTEHPFLDFNIQNSMPFSVAQMGPGTAIGDVNGDHLDDIFIGGAKFKKGTFFLQQKDGGFSKSDLLPAIDTTQKRSEDTGVLFFDADSDGDQDLYIVSGGNEDFPKSASFKDRLYENINGNFNLSSTAIPDFTESGACVRAADYDNDGDLDLFISGRISPTEYPKATSSTLLRNDSKIGQIKFSNVTAELAPDFTDLGLICDGLWTDFDNDGDMDLITAGDFMAITVFRNIDGVLEKLENTGLENHEGIWNSLNAGDFDQDGDIDYIAGNVGLNGLFKGTEEYPAMLLSGDFDQNDRYDVLPFYYFPDGKGGRVFAPYNGKGDMSRQLNSMRNRYTTYAEYADARAENLLTKEEMTIAKKHFLRYNESSYIENLGDGKFKVSPLPIEAQVAPSTGMLVSDYNSDGFLDVLMLGNNFGNELLIGRMDAHNGLLLLGNGNGTFAVSLHSGFHVPGDAKSLTTLYNQSGDQLVFATQNRNKAKIYKTKVKGTVHELKPNQSKVSYTLNGHKVYFENYFGSSYLSQSSRKVIIPENAKGLIIK